MVAVNRGRSQFATVSAKLLTCFSTCGRMAAVGPRYGVWGMWAAVNPARLR